MAHECLRIFACERSILLDLILLAPSTNRALSARKRLRYLCTRSTTVRPLAGETEHVRQSLCAIRLRTRGDRVYESALSVCVDRWAGV